MGDPKKRSLWLTGILGESGSASQDITDIAIIAPETMASREGIRNLPSINFQGRTVSFSFKDGI